MQETCSVCCSPCTNTCICKQAWYCSHDCQKKDWVSHKLRCPPISCKYDDGKCTGSFSNRKFNRGQILFVEEPLIMINMMSKDSDAVILASFRKLSKTGKQKYLDMKERTKCSENRIVSLFESNCVRAKLSIEDGEWRGIYPKFSKINHSCDPNCVLNIASSGRALKLVASRDIVKGEEVTVNFLDPYRKNFLSSLLFERRKVLKSNWGIICTCSICKLSGPQLVKNEEFKKNLSNLDRKQVSFRGNVMNVSNAMNSFTIERAILELMFKLENEMIREIPECLLNCYMYSRVLQLHRVQIQQHPIKYLDSAVAMASSLGDGYIRRIREKEREVDRNINNATRTIVEESKLKMVKEIQEKFKGQKVVFFYPNP